jgi:hypothetical protein
MYNYVTFKEGVFTMDDKSYKLKFNYGSLSIELDGDKDFVKDEIAFLLSEVQKLQQIKQVEKANTTNLNENKPEIDDDVEIEVVGGQSGNGQTQETNNGQVIHIRQFLETKKAEEAGMKATLLMAYYINNIQKKEYFDEDSLTDIWKASGVKPPIYIWQSAVDSKNKKRWYDEVEKRKYKINANGIYFVENDLKKVK